jgi:hypothetical protein
MRRSIYLLCCSALLLPFSFFTSLPASGSTDAADCPYGGGSYHRDYADGSFRGCVTGYSTAENGSQTFCGEPLDDGARTTSVAKRFRVTVAPCGSIIRVWDATNPKKRLLVKVTDQGPCNDPPACWDNLDRDLDLNKRASVYFKGSSDWSRPVLLRWKVVQRGR